MFYISYIILWDGEPIGIDHNSGGYPFKTQDLNEVYHWPDIDKAKAYINIFQRADSQNMYQEMVVYKFDVDVRVA